MDSSDIITPRELAPLLGMTYSTAMRWLAQNRERLAGCGFKRGTRWEYSRKLLREAGVLREESAHA